jgi:hypothetical protein
MIKGFKPLKYTPGHIRRAREMAFIRRSSGALQPGVYALAAFRTPATPSWLIFMPFNRTVFAIALSGFP